MPATHEVFNQPTPLENYDVAAEDALLDGLRRENAGWATEELHELGHLAGTARAHSWGEQANTNNPTLRTHDHYRPRA